MSGTPAAAVPPVEKDAAVRLLCCHIIRQKLMVPGAVSVVNWREVLLGWHSICEENDLSGPAQQLLALVELLDLVEQCEEEDGRDPHHLPVQDIEHILTAFQNFSDQPESSTGSESELLPKAKCQELGTELLDMLKAAKQPHSNFSIQLFNTKIKEFIVQSASQYYQPLSLHDPQDPCLEDCSSIASDHRDASKSPEGIVVKWSSDESTPPTKLPRRLPPLEVQNRAALIHVPAPKKDHAGGVQRRTRWGEEEVELLKEGVRCYGAGNWGTIKAMQGLKRSNVDIKDKWRNLTSRAK